MHRIARAVRAIKQQQQQVPERQPFVPYVTLRTSNSLSIEWVFEEGVSTNTEKRYLSILQTCEPDTLTWQTVYRGFGCKFCVCCLRAGTLYKLRLRVDRDGVQGPWGEAVTAPTRDETNSIQNLHRAIQYGYFQEVIKIVKSRPTASESTYTDMGLTPLQLAVEQGDQRLVEALLQHFSPAAIDAVSIGGAARTALMIAAGNGSTELVHLLTEHGANWNMIDRNGLTALHYAVDGSQFQMVKFALDNTQGVFVDAKDNCDWTPLLRGVILGSSQQVLECLIKHGAEVNHRDKNGLSCLSAAVIGQRRSVIRLLRNSGADVHLPGDSQQNSPLMIAEELGSEEIVDILSPAVTHVPYTPAMRVNVDSDEENIDE